MILLAHILAVLFYVSAAALAATPFVRPLPAPVRGVVALLGAGVAVHSASLMALGASIGTLPLAGLGPALSFAGLLMAGTLLAVEIGAREVSLALVAGPFAGLATGAAAVVGVHPTVAQPPGVRGAWFVAHIVLSFAGIAAFATAAAAGLMYLVERRELKSRRFGAIFRFFPPLETLDRVNHVAAVSGWTTLTIGVVLAFAYQAAYHTGDLPQAVWGTGAWLGVTALALGRMLGGWQARRAALVSSLTFALIVVVYVALRVTAGSTGQFL